eukprot:c18934_g1_i4.p1 GENE.c18934_g1_i4~~c18934_g1_i4.p1  ORF type:complete len:716 (+),score=135.27 c18934_g1_i4:86-2149(+)
MTKPLAKPSRLKAIHFLLVMCGVATVQSAMVTGVMSAVITTIERRYGFRSSQAGALFSVYDVAALLAVVPVSHYGAIWHIPKTISVGMLVLGTGCLIGSLPQWISGSYRPEGVDTEPLMCGDEILKISCTNSNDTMFGLFILAQTLIGIGACMIFTIGPVYLADASSPTIYPVYLGIFFGSAAVGPALGFIGSGQALNVYVDPGSSTSLTPEDTRWVGGWWIPFVVCAGFAYSVALLLCCFPRSMHFDRAYSPTGHRHSQIHNAHPADMTRTSTTPIALLPTITGTDTDNILEAEPVVMVQPLRPSDTRHTVSSDEQSSTVLKPSKDSSLDTSSKSLTDDPEPSGGLFAALRRVMCNPVFVYMTLAQSSETFMVSAYSAFMAKFLQTQFRLTSSLAAVTTGLIVIPGAAGGIILGGYLVKRLNLTFVSTAKFCVVCSILSTVFTSCTLVGCNILPVAGVNSPYAPTQRVDLFDTCNEVCGCESQGFEPVCGANSVTYFNPCFAGCLSHSTPTVKGTRMFGNCSCIATGTLEFESLTMTAFEAHDGSCVGDDGCTKWLGLFLTGLFLLMAFTFMNHTPSILVLIQTTGDDSPLGLSVNTQWFRILGSIPAPVGFGAILELACALTDTECGKDSCEVYYGKDMRLMFFFLGCGFKAISTVFFGLAWLACKRNPPRHRSTEVASIEDAAL